MQLASGTEIPTQALIFDMDGTLVDSMAVIAALWRRWAIHHGVDADAVALAAPGRRAVETVRMFAPPGVDAAAEASHLTSEAAASSEGLVPVRGALALLRSLPPSRWAVVTSAERRQADRRLRSTGLPLPDILVAAEDVTAGKPNPAGYIQAAERLGHAPSATIVFEDAPAGLAAGAAAGARVIAIATTLTAIELAPHDWLADFSRVTFDLARPERPMLRIGGPTA